MASLNTTRKPKLPPQGGSAPQAFEPSNTLRTHEGAPASAIGAELALRRSVCSCLLWENEFYEDGASIANRIWSLVPHVPVQTVADLAVDARSHFNLRHVPLLLLAGLAKHARGTRLVSDTIADVIQRADELSEFLSVYAKMNEQPVDKLVLSAQVKKGLAKAFTKFDQYQLAKYFSDSGERKAVIKGRDVLHLTHAKARDEVQNELFRRISAKESVSVTPLETWEVMLSRGADKKETFTQLLEQQKLGYLALLRNLRNMAEAGVDTNLVRNAILARRGSRRVLPFRYVAAARACPQFEPFLDQALSEAIADLPAMPGKTAVLVDVSSSMDQKLSGKSDLSRMDAAATLASIIPGDHRVFTFSYNTVEVPARYGMSGIAAITASQPHGGTYLGHAVNTLVNGGPTTFASPYSYWNGNPAPSGPPMEPVEMDRLIVITDEQSHDTVPVPARVSHRYMINVASNRNGVGYGGWTHIDGFSEQVLRFIHEFEAM